MGAGIDELRSALDAASAAIGPRFRRCGALADRPRLHAPRDRHRRDRHAVVGRDRGGDRLVLAPAGGEVRVRSVEVHGEAVERAQAGQRVAASLVGVERSAIPGGATLATPGSLPESYRLDVELTPVAGRPGRGGSALVQVLVGTACVEARVALLGAEKLAAGSTGLAQLRLREPVAAARATASSCAPPLRRPRSPAALVLDPAPPRHGAAEDALERLHLLARRRSGLARARGAAGRRLAAAARPHRPPGVLDRAAAVAALTALAEPARSCSWPARSRPGWRRRATRNSVESVREQLEQQRAAEHPLEPVLPGGGGRPGGTGSRCPARAPRRRRHPRARRERTSCSPARAPMPREGTPPRPMRCWRRSRQAASRSPTWSRSSSIPGLAEREFAALDGGARARRSVSSASAAIWPISSEHFERAREIVVARCESERLGLPGRAARRARREAGASPRRCSSASTPTASPGAWKTAASCVAAHPRQLPGSSRILQE